MPPHHVVGMNGNTHAAADSTSDNESPPNSTVVRVRSTGSIVSKRPRIYSRQSLDHSNDDVPTSSDAHHESADPQGDNALIRAGLRTFTYFVYDGFPISSGYRELARVWKVLVEIVVDERYPPPHRADMSLSRKCIEFLLAPATSSLAWFILGTIPLQFRKTKFGSNKGSLLWFKAIRTVIHRTARQALIYRLFFRIGSLKYTLASALGIVCCFFKESIFPDIVRLYLWPKHFSASQGLAAIFRSSIYATAFALPLQRWSKLLKDCPRRRGNVKKLIFALVLAQIQRLTRLHRLVEASQ